MPDLLAAERARARRLDQALARYRQRIERQLPDVVAALAARPEVRRVILFGSVARGDVHLGSDIDLAVEGLSGLGAIHAWLEVEAAASGLPFDLVETERAGDALRAQIAADGVVLYER